MSNQGGNIFDALDAAVEEDHKKLSKGNDPATIEADSRKSQSKVYRVPVTLFKDEKTGEQFFYLQKNTFPNRPISKLDILYTPEEKKQVKEQVEKDHHCPEIILKNIQIECFLDDKNLTNDDTPPDDLLTDESFRLSGSKIAAIRMRMYAKQKQDAQKQLQADPNCDKITLRLDLECRLANRDKEKSTEVSTE